MKQNVEMSRYENTLGRRHQLVRLLWWIVWGVGARWIPRSLCGGWKRTLLRLFGAKVAKTARVYSTAKIYYPPFLTMEDYATLDGGVNCYNVAPIVIERNATVSQGAFLCTASHDISHPHFRLLVAPIRIEAQAWVAAEAFVGMGVTVGEGAVVGARAVATHDVAPWTVVAGNPAKVIKSRAVADPNS